MKKKIMFKTPESRIQSRQGKLDKRSYNIMEFNKEQKINELVESINQVKIEKVMLGDLASFQIANGGKKARFVRRSWRGSNPRLPPRRSRVCAPFAN